VLIAGEDSFDAEDHLPISSQGALLKKRCRIALGGGQGVIVADENHVGCMQSLAKLVAIEERIVLAEGLGELAQILAAAIRILSADFAFDHG
jgi:hypothetical protein